MGEEIFQDHLITSDREQTKAMGDLKDNIKDGKISSTDKVVPFEQSPHFKNQKSTTDFSLDFIFPGECYEIRKDIQNIFDEEYKKACLSSTTFQQCFSKAHIEALFRNEKKVGDLITTSKL